VEINEDHGEITTNCKLTRTPPKQQTQEIAPRRFPPIDLHEKKNIFDIQLMKRPMENSDHKEEFDHIYVCILWRPIWL